LAENLKSQGLTGFDFKDLTQGLEDTITPDKEQQVSSPEANQIVQTTMQAKAMKLHEAHIEIGAKFLEENGKREEVTVSPSGLQFEVLKEGDGAMPRAEDEVTTHYHGTLIDGTVFDSSVERGQPATFPLNRVIKGWTEALQLMKVGSKWRLYVPFNLAYGDQAAGEHIKPFSTLIFEVELLDIKK